MKQALPITFGLFTFITLFNFPTEIEWQRWIGFSLVVAFAGLDMARRWLTGAKLQIDHLDLALALLIIWGLVSLTWTPVSIMGVQACIIAVAVWLLQHYLRHHAEPEIKQSICWSVGLGLIGSILTNAWLAKNQWSGYGNSGYLAESIMLIIPFMWPIWAGRAEYELRHAEKFKYTLAQLFAYMVAGLCIWWQTMISPSLIPFAVLGIWAFIWSLRTQYKFAILIGWLAFGIAGITLGWHHISDHVMVRVELDLNAWHMIMARPFGGWGLGSFIETYPIFKESSGLFYNSQFQSYTTEAEALHNEIIQTICELGIIGFIAFIYLCWNIFHLFSKSSSSPYRITATLGLSALAAESLLEYPIQRAATLFLGCLLLGMLEAGRPIGQPRFISRFQWKYIAVCLMPFVAVALIFCSFRQFESEGRIELTKQPGVDPANMLNMTIEAAELNPLSRHAIASLPVFLDNVLQKYGVGAIKQEVIDRIYYKQEKYAAYNTAALLSKAQYLFLINGLDTPEWSDTMQHLHQGSTHVAGAWAIDARYWLVHQNWPNAYLASTEGLKWSHANGQFPSADLGIEQNLRGIQLAAATMMAAPHPGL